MIITAQTSSQPKNLKSNSIKITAASSAMIE